MKGRAAAARYYLEAVLEWIARNEGLGGGTTGSGKGFRTIVDIVDCNGDTALNIAARVGNRSLVGLFLSVQADKTIPNKMGLRAGDYGCEEEVGLSASNEIDFGDASFFSSKLTLDRFRFVLVALAGSQDLSR